MHRMLVCLVLAACGSSAGPDLSSPSAAARCQVAAVHAQNLDQWEQCVHPDVRAEFRAKLEKTLRRRPETWVEAQKRMQPLATVKDADFTVEPMKPGRESHGDSFAWYRFGEHEKTEAVRKDGRWYIVDPD
jgi:hypothetical protein